MAARREDALEQQLNNLDAAVLRQKALAREADGQAPVRADATVTAVTATFDAICMVSLAPTAEGRANQFTELRADIHALPDPWGSSMVQKWDRFIGQKIAEERARTGRPPEKRERAVKYIEDRVQELDDPGVPIPQAWVHEAAEETGYSVARLKQALRELGYKIAPAT